MAVASHEISPLLNEPSESGEESVGFFDNFSSLLPEPIKSEKKTAEFAPEDIAWVDSCFAFNSESSYDNSIALKETFLDALSSYPIQYEAISAMESNDYNDTVQASKAVQQDHVIEHRLSEKIRIEISNIEVSGSGEEIVSHDTNFKVKDDPVLEYYHLSELTQKEAFHVDISETREEDVEARESIFKMWDLETSVIEEEDELIQQLEKLLIGRRLQDPSDRNLTLSQESVDELIASLSDLSLKYFDN